MSSDWKIVSKPGSNHQALFIILNCTNLELHQSTLKTFITFKRAYCASFKIDAEVAFSRTDPPKNVHEGEKTQRDITLIKEPRHIPQGTFRGEKLDILPEAIN